MSASRTENSPATASEGDERWRSVRPVTSKIVPGEAGRGEEQEGEGDLRLRADEREARPRRPAGRARACS